MALTKITGEGVGAVDNLTVDTNTLVVDAANNRVGIGTAAPDNLLTISGGDSGHSWSYDSGDLLIVEDNDSTSINIATPAANGGNILFSDADARGQGRIAYTHSSDKMEFMTGGISNTRMTIDSSGDVLIGKSSSTFSTPGFHFDADPDQLNITTNQNTPLRLNRVNNDGAMISFQGDSSEEGTISISGGTVALNGGHLSRWSRLLDGSKPSTILKGTVMSNLNDMIVWSHDATDAVLDDDGNEIESARDAYTEDNEQLNHTKISDAEGDADVAGVFVAWDDRDDFNDFFLAMTGDMVIRIASGTTVARGDLLMSAGDGTAKPQDDDIVRSKTIAKVTSTNVSHTYDDGSYLVPCVLMAC